MFSVVDNRYRGEGFAFIIEDQAHADRWKNNQHLDTPDRAEAVSLRDAINAAFEEE